MRFLSQKISKPVFCSTSVWQVLWGTAPQTDLSCIDDGFHSEGCSNLKKEQELKKKKALESGSLQNNSEKMSLRLPDKLTLKKIW